MALKAESVRNQLLLVALGNQNNNKSGRLWKIYIFSRIAHFWLEIGVNSKPARFPEDFGAGEDRQAPPPSSLSLTAFPLKQRKCMSRIS